MLGHLHDHGKRPHLCVELSDAQFVQLQDIVDRAKRIYGVELKGAVLRAFAELEKEVDVMEDALKGKGRRLA